MEKSMQRPEIPAEIRRAVLVEAGHRCAIPRCGETEIDVHHIVPWSECKKHEYSNLIALCLICHRRVHKGEIDRKALFQYKSALTSGTSAVSQSGFEAPIVEIRRRISERSSTGVGYIFEFDFPDFPGAVQRVVSKNLEAWGNELLVQLREHQTEYNRTYVRSDAEGEGLFSSPSSLRGSYRIVRNDEVVISLEYVIDRFNSGNAHGGRGTRVQNFLIRPFQPIGVMDLLNDLSSLQDLSDLIRKKLLSSGKYEDEEWVRRGTEPQDKNFSRFVIENHCIRFIFEEYQIDCYAVGRQALSVGFNEMREIGNLDLLSKLKAGIW